MKLRFDLVRVLLCSGTWFWSICFLFIYMNSVGFEFGYDLEYQIFNWVLIICILDINFGILRNMVLDTFWEFCLETYDYNDDDLGAHSMWFRLGRVTPLDGAAPMERPPLGGEGYQWEVKLLNWKCFTLVLSREKRAIR